MHPYTWFYREYREQESVRDARFLRKPVFFMRKEVRGVKRCEVNYLDDRMLERIHAARKAGNRPSAYYGTVDELEFPLLSMRDYEGRLKSGFKLFEMPEKGYPAD